MNMALMAIRVEFTNLVFQQSPDIAQGVNEGEGEYLGTRVLVIRD